MKLGFFRALSWISVLMDEVNTAYGDDQEISAKEMLEMFINISRRVDLPVSNQTQQVLDSVVSVLDETQMVIEDKKVTVSELLKLSKIICEKMGYELDDEVLDVEDFDDLEKFLKDTINRKEE